MKRIKHAAIALAAAGTVAAAGSGLASAATMPTANSDVGTSGIPRTTFKQDRQQAEAQLLGTTVADIQSARKNKTFKQLLSKAGLDEKSFRQKVETQLTNELKAQGYSQDQITIALQYRHIVHMRKDDKK